MVSIAGLYQDHEGLAWPCSSPITTNSNKDRFIFLFDTPPSLPLQLQVTFVLHHALIPPTLALTNLPSDGSWA
jgi:hypothetical protein